MTLKDLFPAFRGEDNENECKLILNSDPEKELSWLKSVAGFANAKGGNLYLGVENKTYELIGYSLDELDEEKLRFYDTINKRFLNKPVAISETIPFKANGVERYILKIRIEESDNKPVIFVHKKMPLIYVKRDGYSDPATAEEIRQMALSSSAIRFDNQTTNIPFNEKDFTKLYDFYAERVNGKKLSKKELSAISFIDKNGNISRGAYLFADNFQGSETRVVCSSYKGLTKGDDMIVASMDFNGNLIDSYHFIWDFLQARMNHGFIKLSTSRINIDAYPSRAIFEAIINSLAHRDYFLEGTQISVDLFYDRLVITSPGSLYNAGDLKPTYNIESLNSNRRNPLICDVFVRCKAMEAKGTGLEKIKEEYKDQDINHQPFVFSRNNQFIIVLPDLTFDEGISIAREALTILGEIKNKTSKDEEILYYCYEKNRSVKEIAAHLGVANSTYLRRDVLDNLVNQGYLVESKSGNTKTYITSNDKVTI